MNKELRQKVYRKYNGHCAYCGCWLTMKTLQVDHIIPKFHGGTDDEKNLRPACRSCNYRKATFTIEDFRYHISQQIKCLKSNSRSFTLALRYGLIKETGNKVKFYFEKE